VLIQTVSNRTKIFVAVSHYAKVSAADRCMPARSLVDIWGENLVATESPDLDHSKRCFAREWARNNRWFCKELQQFQTRQDSRAQIRTGPKFLFYLMHSSGYRPISQSARSIYEYRRPRQRFHPLSLERVYLGDAPVDSEDH
jgi:hypothetical protein